MPGKGEPSVNRRGSMKIIREAIMVFRLEIKKYVIA